MARHRSPRGRGAHQSPPLVALGRTVAGEIVRRSAPVPTPLRRGAAAVVVTGGALTLAGVAATDPGAGRPAARRGGRGAAASATRGRPSAADRRSGSAAASLVPVAADAGAAVTEKMDTAKLVKAVQLAERDTHRARPDPADDREPNRPTSRRPGRRRRAPAAREGASRGRGRARRTDGAEGPTPARPARAPVHRLRAGHLAARRGQAARAVRPPTSSAAGSASRPCSGWPAAPAPRTTRPARRWTSWSTGPPATRWPTCALRNQEALGISYVIWRQRINFGSGWKPMEDRGSPTANHMDHVHVSFESAAGGRPPAAEPRLRHAGPDPRSGHDFFRSPAVARYRQAQISGRSPGSPRSTPDSPTGVRPGRAIGTGRT